MGFFKRRKIFEGDKPNTGKVFIRDKKVKINISKAKTNFSANNSVFVGYRVGAGKLARSFSSNAKANAYSSKLLKSNKGLSGKGENRGVVSRPLYYGSNLKPFKKKKIRK